MRQKVFGLPGGSGALALQVSWSMSRAGIGWEKVPAERLSGGRSDRCMDGVDTEQLPCRHLSAIQSGYWLMAPTGRTGQHSEQRELGSGIAI